MTGTAFFGAKSPLTFGGGGSWTFFQIIKFAL